MSGTVNQTNEPANERLAELLNSAPFKSFVSGPYRATDDEITAIEAMAKAPLPATYRWYLQVVGKMLVGSGYSVQPDAHQELPIAVILGGTDLNDLPDSHSIEWNHETFEDVLLDHEIVIAIDITSDVYTMNLITERFRFLPHSGGPAVELPVTGFENFIKVIKPDSKTE